MKKFECNFRKIQQHLKSFSEKNNWNGSHFVFQIKITEKGEGVFYIESQGNILNVQPYDYHDSTAEIQTSWETFFGILEGEITLGEAVNSNLLFIFPKVRDGLQLVMQFFFYACLKSKEKTYIDPKFFGSEINVDATRIFPVVVMATMSSGKSTLINALIGDEILPSRNEACTAKVFLFLMMILRRKRNCM